MTQILDGMTIPKHIESERLCLGACLMNPDVIDDVAEIVTVGDFYRDAHQEIFRQLLAMTDKGIPIDGGSFADHMIKLGVWEKVGGDSAIEDLMHAVPHSAHARYHAGIVRETSLARSLMEVATEIIREGSTGLLTSSDILCMAEEKIFSISENSSVSNLIRAPDLINRSIANIQLRQSGEFLGLPFGLRDLDLMLMGAQDGQFLILAARPSIGKTALVLDIARRVSLVGKKVLFFSLEMPHTELGDRLISSHALIPGDAIKRPKYLLSPEDEQRIYKAATELERLPIVIDDAPQRSMSQIMAIARRLKRKEKLDLVIIDHIGKIEESRQKTEMRHEVVAKISNRIKVMARQLHIPVIALHHINREADKSSDGRPRLHMLRESGSLEQDADVVMLLHRPEFTNPLDQPGIAEVEIAKNRNGQTGVVKLSFRKEFTRFDSLSNRADEPRQGSVPF